MKHTSALFFASILLSLGACSHYSEDLSSLEGKIGGAPSQSFAQTAGPQDIAPAAGTPSGSLSQNLAREYYSLARYENDKAYDYKSSKAFTQKAAMASKGQVTVPSHLNTYDIPSAYRNDLSSARAELITALKTRNTPENAQALAKAQSRFDCWLERAEEATDDKHFAQCKAEFEQAMAMTLAPAAGEVNTAASAYDITFGEGSALIGEASKKDIDYVKALLNDPKNSAYTVTLTGYGTAGDLVTARIKSVADALTSGGVAPSRINPVVAPAADASGKVTLSVIAPSASGPNATTKTEFVPIKPIPVPATR